MTLTEEEKKMSPRRRIDHLLDQLIEAENDYERDLILKKLEEYCPKREK
tara:strand:- start:298 stop:444 length:147 start_codon:yes stop_codon:yes gene_type:complete